MSNKKDRINNKKNKKIQTLDRKNRRRNADIVAEIEATQEVDQTKVEKKWEEFDWVRRYMDFIESLD